MRTAILLLLVTACLAGGPGSDTPQIRVESTLVSVPVIVTDAGGRFVPGLSAADFQLLHDGIPDTVMHFQTSEEPINIALLLDTSRSTATILKNMKKAAERFLLQLRPQDSALVVTFDSEVRVLCPLSSDRNELKDAIRSVRMGGSTTKMRDAVFEIAQRRFRSIPGRKAIVLLTDGQDHGSLISPQDLLDTVAASSTLVYSIFYSVDPRRLMKELMGVSSRVPKESAANPEGPYAEWRKTEEEAARYLESLSELSAGRFYRSDITAFEKAFRQISEELRSQYLLGFYPDASKLDGAIHSIEVRVASPDVTVRNRRSYRATSFPGTQNRH